MYILFLLIIINDLNAQSQNTDCTVQISLDSTYSIALKKLINKPEQEIANDIQNIFNKNNINFKEDKLKLYYFVVMINGDGTINKIIKGKDVRANPQIVSLIEQYIKSLEPFGLVPYIDRYGKKRKYMDNFILFINAKSDDYQIQVSIR